MNLTEFVSKATKQQKDYYKGLLSEGLELPDNKLAEEAQQEYLIESYSEIVNVLDEINLTEETINEDGLVEYYDFVPDMFGQDLDIEIELDTSVIDPSLKFLTSLKESLGAKEYDIEFISEDQAKVVFSRTSGNIEKKKKCAPGTKLKGNRCVAQTGGEKAVNKKQGIVLKRAKRAQGAAVKKRAAVKAQITKDRVANRTRNFSGT